ncbi:MAG: cation:proton antiporter [Nanoarchaeota archaeon]|nr:cation:proton antiporter [Nanoarchaeota archaeon]
MENVFFDIGLIIIVATLLGYFARLMRQPLIPAYILAGAIIGPAVLGLVTDAGLIRNLAEIGIAFLLFMVGLELDFKRLKCIGGVGSVGGLIKTAILFVFGYFIASQMNFTGSEPVYIAVVLSLSSTMVVVKLLSDKQELDTLHGRIVLGILLMEDLIAILFLAILAPNSVGFPIVALIKGILVLGLLYLLTRSIFPSLFKFGARYTELLVLLALSTCFLFSMISHSFGFSIAIGAFIAGVSLANLPYNYEIASRVKSLRDFFSVLFFVTLGMKLVLTDISSLVPTLIIFTVFVVVFKPIVIMVITSFFGYSIRTGFQCAMSLAQISEFSLIIITSAMMAGQISERLFTLTILLAVITISLSTYFIEFSRQSYEMLRKALKVFQVRLPLREFEFMDKDTKYNAVLIGYDRTGYSIVKKLHMMKKKLLVVDFNPEVIKKLISQHVHCIYGDISDIDILDRIEFRHVETVISSAPVKKDNLLLIKKVKEKNPKISIFVTAYHLDDALELYDMGADYVILPHFIGGDHLSVLLEEVTPDISKLVRRKIKHIKELKLRHRLGHENANNRHIHS